AGETVTEPQESALSLTDQTGKGLDRLDRATGNRGRPFGVARAQMFGKFARRVRIAFEIIPIRFLVAEQAMHHRAGERAVGARPAGRPVSWWYSCRRRPPRSWRRAPSARAWHASSH